MGMAPVLEYASKKLLVRVFPHYGDNAMHEPRAFVFANASLHAM
jgi:hypothetical protein